MSSGSGSDQDSEDEVKINEKRDSIHGRIKHEKRETLKAKQHQDGKRARFSRALTSQQRNEIEKAFVMFDSSGDGFIDQKELKQAMKALGMQSKTEDIARIMDNYREPSGNISKTEFTELMRPMLGGKDPYSEIRKTFEYFDVRSQKRIEMKDLKAAMADIGEEVSNAELEAMMDIAARETVRKDMIAEGAPKLPKQQHVTEKDFIRLCNRLNLGLPWHKGEQEELGQIHKKAADAKEQKKKQEEEGAEKDGSDDDDDDDDDDDGD